MQSTNWSSSSYGKEYLFRVSLIDKNWWSRSSHSKKQTVYIVGYSKDHIREVVRTNFNPCYEITSISQLAAKSSGNLYIKEAK